MINIIYQLYRNTLSTPVNSTDQSANSESVEIISTKHDMLSLDTVLNLVLLLRFYFCTEITTDFSSKTNLDVSGPSNRRHIGIGCVI